MTWRKWVVRGLVFTVTGAIAAAALAYQHWTNPSVIRQQVIAKLEKHLPGANVSLESARLRLLGGISFEDLRLRRRDDTGRTDFVNVPSGTIYHDKEQLLHGKLAIRKIVWHRPTLRVIRRKDGSWNLAKVLAPPTPEIPIPTIVLQHATILVEDHQSCSDLPPLEIKDVDLTIINDPLLTLEFVGTGVSELTGPIEFKGSLGRVSDEFAGSLQLAGFSISGALVQRLAAYFPEVAVHARRLTGIGKFQAEFTYNPRSPRPWSYEIDGQLRKGKFSHVQLPYLLENVEAQVRCVDGLVSVQELKAQAAGAKLSLSGRMTATGMDADLEGKLKLENLQATSELFAVLPKALQEIQADYEPKGVFNLDLEVLREKGRWRVQSNIRPLDVTSVCARFPYPVDHVSGMIKYNFEQVPGTSFLDVNLVAYAGEQPIYIQGTVDGKKPAAVAFKVWSKNLLLDHKLRAALQPQFQAIVDSFHPQGRADFVAFIRREQGQSQLDNQYIIDFHDVSVRHNDFPYAVEDITGTLEIHRDRWEFREFRGKHKGGEIHGHAGSLLQGNEKGVQIGVTGNEILLDDELEAALKQPALKNTWKKLNPSGRIAFEAHVDHFPGRAEPDIAVTVTPLGSTIVPEFFPYVLANLRGSVHYRQHQVELKQLSAEHGRTQLNIAEGKIDLKPGGGLSVDLINLVGNPVVPDVELFRALPASLGSASARLQLRDPLSLLANRLIIDVPPESAGPPYIYWDGGVRLEDATLQAGVHFEHVSGVIACRGEHHGKFGNVAGNLLLQRIAFFNQPLEELHSRIVLDARNPDVLELADVSGRLFGGDVGGWVRVEFGPTLRYEVNLTASEMKLEEFGRHNQLGPKAHLSGLASARLFLQGKGAERSGIEGGGSLDVPSGKMLNLPLLLDLIKVLNLRWPDRTAFEEARIRFSIRGQRVEFSQLDLFGNSVSLKGQGTMNLDGSDLNLDFSAVWARITQALPPIIDQLPAKFSESLLKIKMRGSIGGKIEYVREPVPILVEPIKGLQKRMSKKEN